MSLSTLESVVQEGYEQIVDAPNRERVLEDLDEVTRGVLEEATPDVVEAALAVSSHEADLVLPDTGGILVPNQGYLGRLVFKDNELQSLDIVSASGGLQPAQEDPIQAAWGEGIYAPMVWPKALRAAAFLHRRKSPEDDTPIEKYLGKLDLALGSDGRRLDDGSIELYGAIGWMPTAVTLREMLSSMTVVATERRLLAATHEVLRGSGLSNQLVTDLAAGDPVGPDAASMHFADVVHRTKYDPKVDWN